MRQYVKENVSFKASVTMKWVTKMTASSSETIMFVFLGLSTITVLHDPEKLAQISWSFVGITVFLTFVARVMAVWLQTYFVNKWRVAKFTVVEMVNWSFCYF
jgi:NhaP-type Na+/H+ and K+/H+ antiporter